MDDQKRDAKTSPITQKRPGVHSRAKSMFETFLFLCFDLYLASLFFSPEIQELW
jgi:hypothetical protein